MPPLPFWVISSGIAPLLKDLYCIGFSFLRGFADREIVLKSINIIFKVVI
jgi:hypothetical protein